MPKNNTLSSQDADQPRSKRQKLTSSQLERKRELDREAQRTIRERTKNHIAHLESLVQQLQGDQGTQVQQLVAQLNESRAEVNRLKDALNSIIKISASVTGTTTTQSIANSIEDGQVKEETSPDPAPAQPNSEKQFIKLHPATQITARRRNTDVREREDFNTDNLLDSNPDAHPEHPISFPNYHEDAGHNGHVLPQDGDVEELDMSLDGPDSVNMQDDQLSVSQMAAQIVQNSSLEGRYWYLAGVLLTQILKKQQQGGFISFADDEDIAIRAVFEGWSSVMERYPLDRGWQWLKELDEAIYFHHFGPAERLMNLRNCRFKFLHQCYPDAGWNKHLPHFYATSTPQYLEVDPLVEHFPWPGFRKRLMLSPRKFATNKFMETLRRNLHFVWNHDPQALYHKDPFSGQYIYSDLFIKHIMDIKCYSARPAFFINFPELGRDIPWNRNDYPSPYHTIIHRFSAGSDSTSSHQQSPAQEEGQDNEGADKAIDLHNSNFPNTDDWHLAITTTSPLSTGYGTDLT